MAATKGPISAPLIDRLRLAMLWAVDRKLPLSPDGYGVICTSGQVPRWERDPKAPTIDPIGAAILREQPDVGDVLRAAMLALNANEAEISGFESGLCGNPANDAFLTSPRGKMYARAFQDGLWIRAELVAKVCIGAMHGRFTEVTCPMCEIDLDRRIELADEDLKLQTQHPRGHA